MDKYIHTVLNSINNLYENRFIQAQNLANVSVPGYRKDISVKPTGSVFLDLEEACPAGRSRSGKTVTSLTAHPVPLTVPIMITKRLPIESSL